MSLRARPRFPSYPSSPLSLPPSPAIFISFKAVRSFHSVTGRRYCGTYPRVPARDRVVDFGKYKGQMLGTLPSKYLTWVSENLRAGDFIEWAKCADEVLQDPYYRDRLEWELAEKVLQGNETRAARSQSAVSDLLELSERFGWDNEDKDGWKKVDFSLLGTSRGGRIPRIRDSDPDSCSSVRDSELRNENWSGLFEMQGSRSKAGRSSGSLKQDLSYTRSSRLNSVGSSGRIGTEGNPAGAVMKKGKVGSLSEGFRYYDVDEKGFEEVSGMGKREERRERRKLKREMQMQELKSKAGDGQEDEEGGNVIHKNFLSRGKSNPFPGREALLRKIHG